MKQTLLTLAMVMFAVAGRADETRHLFERTATSPIAGQTMASARSFEVENVPTQPRWQTMTMYAALTDADNSVSDMAVSCTGSIDNNTTDYRIPVCQWSSSDKKINCEEGTIHWNPSDEASVKKQVFFVTVATVEDYECTFTPTGGAAADLLTVDTTYSMGTYQLPGGSGGAGGSGGGTACTPASGAPTLMVCTTGADADSGALTADKTYRIMCDTDAWVDFHTAASNAAADDTYVPAFQPFEFSTFNGQVHVSCLSVAVNGDCRITRCQ